MNKVTLKIQGMHCVSCSINIDGELEDTPGVISATTSYAKAVSEIEYDADKVNVASLQQVVAKLGYKTTI